MSNWSAVLIDCVCSTGSQSLGWGESKGMGGGGGGGGEYKWPSFFFGYSSVSQKHFEKRIEEIKQVTAIRMDGDGIL